jgi:hypothetical protein
MAIDWTFHIGEICVVIATFFGPIAAVQAQKWIERTREQRQRQVWIFRTLMTTRAAPLSPAHVEALNGVPLEFYGESTITEPWKEYIDHLSTQIFNPETWAQKRSDLLAALLLRMAEFLSYRFTRVEINKEVYSPTAHGQIELEHQIIRQGLAKLFSGQFPIPMEVKGFPVDKRAHEEQQILCALLQKWLCREISVKVELQEPEPKP